ncbi:hypothetical protein LZ32DRAFT_381425 [Colletotrichum eremochloae]|nr:hypothetical protein LZ32DRAFT_381425 [Colletotrichum eremochloae]
MDPPKKNCKGTNPGNPGPRRRREGRDTTDFLPISLPAYPYSEPFSTVNIRVPSVADCMLLPNPPVCASWIQTFRGGKLLLGHSCVRGVCCTGVARLDSHCRCFVIFSVASGGRWHESLANIVSFFFSKTLF